MSIQPWKVGGAAVLLALLSVGLTQSADTPKTAIPNETPFSGKAIYIDLKGSVSVNGQSRTYLFLEQPHIKVLGDRSFLVGRSIEQPVTVWVPLADVAAIQEFADVKAMSKVFSLPGK